MPLDKEDGKNGNIVDDSDPTAAVDRNVVEERQDDVGRALAEDLENLPRLQLLLEGQMAGLEIDHPEPIIAAARRAIDDIPVYVEVLNALAASPSPDPQNLGALDNEANVLEDDIDPGEEEEEEEEEEENAYGPRVEERLPENENVSAGDDDLLDEAAGTDAEPEPEPQRVFFLGPPAPAQEGETDVERQDRLWREFKCQHCARLCEPYGSSVATAMLCIFRHIHCDQCIGRNNLRCLICNTAEFRTVKRVLEMTLRLDGPVDASVEQNVRAPPV